MASLRVWPISVLTRPIRPTYWINTKIKHSNSIRLIILV